MLFTHFKGIKRAGGAGLSLEWELPEICTFQLSVVLLVLHFIAEHKHSAIVKLVIHEANDATGCLLLPNLAQLATSSELTMHNAVRANDADYAESLEKCQLCLILRLFVLLLQLVLLTIEPLNRVLLLQLLELHVALFLGAFLDDHLADVAH